MHDFWSFIVLSNPLKSWVIVAGTILFVIALKRFLSQLIARLIFRFIRRIGSDLDRSIFLDLVVDPIGTFLVVFVSITSIEKLHFPLELDFDIYEVKSKAIIQALALIILITCFFWLLLRLVDFIAVILRTKARKDGSHRDNQLIVFVRDFLKAVLGIIGVLMILSEAFKVDITAYLSTLGLAGAAVALAAKESIENLIASFVIFFDKPFKAGDFLRVSNISGTVERIGLRSTRIRTEQKTYVTVPNKQMVDSVVDNLTLRTQRKGELRLELSLSTPVARLDAFIAGAKNILVKDNVENSTVFLNDITGTAFLVNLDYFTSPLPINEFNAIKQQVNLDIMRLLEQMEIEIAGESTTVSLPSTAADQGPAAASAQSQATHAGSGPAAAAAASARQTKKPKPPTS
jgi:MscS family membrane protein